MFPLSRAPVRSPSVLRSWMRQAVWKHIKDHALQDADDGRVIHCDATLSNLLRPPQATIHMIKDLPRLMAALLPSKAKGGAGGAGGAGGGGGPQW